MTKFPEDLRVYEHLLWEARPNVVVEIGVQHGAIVAVVPRPPAHAGVTTAASRAPRVVGLDIDIAAAERNLDRRRSDAGVTSIALLEGDVREQATVDRVLAAVPDGRLVPGHRGQRPRRRTRRWPACAALARLVRPGGFFVVEDGCVDVEGMRLDPGWPRGVLPAVEEWLAGPDGRDFAQPPRARAVRGDLPPRRLPAAPRLEVLGDPRGLAVEDPEAERAAARRRWPSGMSRRARAADRLGRARRAGSIIAWRTCWRIAASGLHSRSPATAPGSARRPSRSARG